MRMTAIGAEGVIVVTHGHAERGGDSFLTLCKVTGALDQILQRQIVGTLFQITHFQHCFVKRKSGLLIRSRRCIRHGFNRCFFVALTSILSKKI